MARPRKKKRRAPYKPRTGIDDDFKQMVQGMKRRQEAFISPQSTPCNHIDCLAYNEFGQCPDCGWLKPLKGDTDNPWMLPMREMPMGPGGICMLGLSDEEAAYIKELGGVGSPTGA